MNNIIKAVSIFTALNLIIACSDDDEQEMMMAMDQEQTMEMETEQTSSGYSCGNSDHPNVGKLAVFMTHHHQVAGQALIQDNCTIEVSSFTYDGQGPDVYFFGAIDGDFENNGVYLSEQINGMSYSNETLTLELTSASMLDKFNSISVWCEDFAVSFGDGIFQ